MDRSSSVKLMRSARNFCYPAIRMQRFIGANERKEDISPPSLRGGRLECMRLRSLTVAESPSRSRPKPRQTCLALQDPAADCLILIAIVMHAVQKREQCLAVLFHAVSVASFGCRESQADIVGHPGSIGIAKLRFQDHPNLLQILAASLVGEALKKLRANVSRQPTMSPGNGVGRGISAMLSTRNPARSSLVA